MDDYHKKLLEELASLSHWYQRFDLGGGLYTNQHPEHLCYDPEKRWELIEPFIPKNLSGKSVLDLGCNAGYFSMKMKQRGASRVVAVDTFDETIKKVRFISNWYDLGLEIVKEDVHAYCLTTDQRFDYVLFLGLFYHLKYGTIVLDRLAEMTKCRLFFQTVTVGLKTSNNVPQENYTEEQIESRIKSQEFPIMCFIENKFNNDPTNWWLANEDAAISLLRSAKLKIIANPYQGMFVCEPDKPLGKKVYEKLVFPRYGKEGSHILPK